MGSSLRYGVIGLQGAGAGHLRAARALEGAGLLTVAAVCDIRPDLLREAVSGMSVATYTDYQEMLAHGHLDVVSICTPHFLHAPMTLAALDAGVHVLCEKPIAVSVSEADQMVHRARERDRLLGIGHQGRTSARAVRIKGLLDEAGPLVRGVWLAGGIRTQAYFDSAHWRGTWAMEGGGTLINQKVHDLDRLVWYLGMPRQVFALTANPYHARISPGIETVASAVLGWESGAQLVFQVSIADGWVSEYQEFHCEAAAVVCSREVARIGRFPARIHEHIATARERMQPLEVAWEDVAVAGGGGSRKAMLEDFHLAVRTGRPPLCSGEQGRDALEVVNAIMLSGYTRQPVSLPLDRGAYDAFLAEMRAGEGGGCR